MTAATPEQNLEEADALSSRSAALRVFLSRLAEDGALPDGASIQISIVANRRAEAGAGGRTEYRQESWADAFLTLNEARRFFAKPIADLGCHLQSRARAAIARAEKSRPRAGDRTTSSGAAS